jgi:hypothetical protein
MVQFRIIGTVGKIVFYFYRDYIAYLDGSGNPWPDFFVKWDDSYGYVKSGNNGNAEWQTWRVLVDLSVPIGGVAIKEVWVKDSTYTTFHRIDSGSGVPNSKNDTNETTDSLFIGVNGNHYASEVYLDYVKVGNSIVGVNPDDIKYLLKLNGSAVDLPGKNTVTAEWANAYDEATFKSEIQNLSLNENDIVNVFAFLNSDGNKQTALDSMQLNNLLSYSPERPNAVKNTGYTAPYDISAGKLNFELNIQSGSPDNIKFLLKHGTEYKRWTGSAWTTQDVPQNPVNFPPTDQYLNSLAEFQAGIQALALTKDDTLNFHTFILSDGDTQSEILDAKIVHNTQYPDHKPKIFKTTGFTAGVNYQAGDLDFNYSITAGSENFVKFSLIIDGVEKYWDGDSWEDLAGNLNLLNTAAEFQTGIQSLSVTQSQTLNFYTYLVGDGTNVSEIDTASLTDNYIYSNQNPAIRLTTAITVSEDYGPGDLTFNTTEVQGTLGYTLSHQGQEKYWTGSQWDNVSQSPPPLGEINNSTEFETGVQNLAVASGETLNFNVYLVSNGIDQSEIALAKINSPFDYSTKKPAIKLGTPITAIRDYVAGQLEFAAVETSSSPNGYMRYTLAINGTEKFWTGSQWDDVLNTPPDPGEMNDLATFTAGIAALTLTTGDTVNFNVYLVSDGSFQPKIDEAIIKDKSYIYADTSPAITKVLDATVGFNILAGTLSFTVEGVEDNLPDSELGFSLKLNGIQRYWDGGNWVAGSQTNTLAEFQTGISQLGLNQNDSLNFYVFLISNGIEQVKLDKAAISVLPYSAAKPTITLNTPVTMSKVPDSLVFPSFPTTPTFPNNLRFGVKHNGVIKRYTASGWEAAGGADLNSENDFRNKVNDLVTEGVLQPGDTLDLVVQFLSNGNDQTDLDHAQINGGQEYPIDKGYYLRTNTNTIDISEWENILKVVVDSNTPAGTQMRMLFSVNNRSSWLRWGGTQWEEVIVGPLNDDIHTEGNDKAVIENLSQADWGLLIDGQTTLDVAIGLKSTDTGQTPEVDKIQFQYLLPEYNLKNDTEVKVTRTNDKIYVKNITDYKIFELTLITV